MILKSDLKFTDYISVYRCVLCFDFFYSFAKSISLIMNLKLLAGFLVCLNLFQISNAQTKQHQIISIAFYNLENLFDTDDDPKRRDEDFTPTGSYRYTEELYKKKLQNMSSVLSKIAVEKTPDGPAFFGVAEVENERVLRDLVKEPELKNRNYQIVHFESPDLRGIDVGLLYNPSLFKVLEANAMPVVLNKNNKREYTRDVLYVKGILAATDTVHIMVGHWPSRRGGEAASAWKRGIAAQVCRDKANEIFQKDPNAKVVVMGDLNDDPVSPSVTKVLGATGNEADAKSASFYNPWMKLYKKGIGTLGYNDSWNLFDQIIISSAFLSKEQSGWRYYSAEIFKRNFMISQFGQYKGYPHRTFSGSTWIDGYSDHFPTYIYLVKEL